MSHSSPILPPGSQTCDREEPGGAGPVPELRSPVPHSGRGFLEVLILTAVDLRLLSLPPSAAELWDPLPVRGHSGRPVPSPAGV